MAGAIIISDENIWGASSVVFDLIVGKLRPLLIHANEQLSEAFQPSEYGSSFVALDEIGDNNYRLFVQQSRKTYKMCRQEVENAGLASDFDRLVLQQWEELNRQLSDDPRSGATAG